LRRIPRSATITGKGVSRLPSNLDHPAADPALHRKLQRWVTEALITPAEAAAIEGFETAQARRVETPSRRIPLVTEALGYLGAVLALVAGIVVASERWEDLDPLVRVTAIGVGAVTLFALGWLLRTNDEPAIGRLASVLWALSSGLVLWLGWTLCSDVLETSDRTAGILSGSFTIVASGAYYLVLRRPLQQVALAVAIAFTLGFAVFEPAPNGVVRWVMGVVWFLLGGANVLRPQRVALAVGGLLALESAMTLGTADVPGVGFPLGLATAAALIAASVAMRETPLLVIGVIGLFVFLTRTVAYYFHGTLGAPIALLAAGAIVLAVAIVLARRGPTRTGPRSPS
jgi:hypothetical protein